MTSVRQSIHGLDPVRQDVGLLLQVCEIKAAVSTDYRPIISEHDDELAKWAQNYSKNQRLEDYLDSFKHFAEQPLNQNAALAVVVKRPRDLTRAQLKEVKLLLDGEGCSEANMQSVVRQQSNQDFAISYIGHIRHVSSGEVLQPFEQRKAQSMDRIYNSHDWQPNQWKCLERLAIQWVFEVIVDREFVNTCFAEHGGAKRLDRVLNKRLTPHWKSWVRHSGPKVEHRFPATLESIDSNIVKIHGFIDI